MSATTGFDLSNLTEHINETEMGLLFYTESLMQNDTVAFVQQYGFLRTGLKNSQYKLPTLDMDVTLKDGEECGFTPTDEAELDQTDLFMKSITIQGQFCVRELEPFYFGDQLPAGQHYTGFSPVEQAIIGRLKEAIARKLALFPYYGPTGSDTITYDTPWIDLLEGATGIVEDTTPETITAGGSAGTDTAGAYNIVERLVDTFYNNIDTAGDANNGNIVISMSPKVMRLYFLNYQTLFGSNTVVPIMRQLATGNYSTWNHPGSNISIASQNALGHENQIIAQRRGNQTMGFDLLSDATKIKMGMDQYEEYIWWKVRLKMGTAWRSLLPTSVRYYGAAS